MSRIFYSLLIALCCFSLHASAQETGTISDYNDFRHIPVLHDGRVKPLESFSRAQLRDFSGQTNLEGGTVPTAWLAETLFDPAEAALRPIFHVTRPALWDLPPRKKKLFSYAELSAALYKNLPALQALRAKPPEEWSPDQHELITLHDKMLRYGALLRSLSALLPLTLDIPEKLRRELNMPEQESYTLSEWQKHTPAIRERIRKIVAAKGDRIEQYTDEERQIALLGWQLQSIEEAATGNMLLRIIPPQWGGEEWLSPWALTQSGKGAPAAQTYLNHWEDMAHAWRAGDAQAWRKATQTARAASVTLSSENPRPWRLNLEVLYQRIPTLLLAMILYLVSFVTLTIQTCCPKLPCRTIGTIALFTGAALHAFAVIARVLILDRPPVGTLYESILFVALVCVLAGTAYKKHGFMLSALCGFFLLFLANGFATGDTMQVLVAVLNTDFWLTIHVLCITAGYGISLLAGVLGHAALFTAARGTSETDNRLQTALKTSALAALLLTATGTILGGIWADQSWGRFWGWDPKENGALLIVLWLIWLLHARIAGQLGRLSFATCLAFVNVVVALAWFGVNLLSTGLHSYGFIEGVATGLFSFCAAETLLIAGLFWLARRRAGESPA